MINDSQYRKSWSFFPTGVSILATQDDNENYLGMTANSVMSISLNPKIIMVSVGNNRSILKFLQETKNASVSILSSKQSNVAEFFSSSTQNLLENNNFLVSFSSSMNDKTKQIKSFLFDNVYNHWNLIDKRQSVEKIISDLFKYFINSPDKLPNDWRNFKEPLERIICDYISGMTDRYASRLHKDLYA